MPPVLIRSILKHVHSAALSGLISSHNPDLLCLTETWIKYTTTGTELAHCTPPNYSLLSFPRPFNRPNNKSEAAAGGTAFLIREPFTQLSSSEHSFTSFESSSVTLKLPGSKMSVFNVYRPHSTSHYSKPNSFFFSMSSIVSCHLPPSHLMNLSSLAISIFTSMTVLPIYVYHRHRDGDLEKEMR